MCDNRLTGEAFEAAQHPFISQTVIDSLTSCGEEGGRTPQHPTTTASTLLRYSVIG